MLEKIRAHELSEDTIRRSISRWSVPAKVRQEMLAFFDDLELGKVTKGRKASLASRAKYLYLLKVPLEFFSKRSDAITLKDVEKFEQAISSDHLKSKFSGRPFSHATKINMRKALRVFFRWRLGEAAALDLAGWLDTRDRERTPDFLREHEIERLYRKSRTAEQRYVVAVLFDAGARAEEFLNIRFEDVHLPEGKENFVKITLKEEYSKTKGRTISLFWRCSLEAVREFLNERIAQGIKSQDPVCLNTYGGVRMFLKRLGNQVLKRSVHPHLFRHSSATFYATKLNRQELCYRYGWRFSSDMPDIYISRAGMENRELDEKFTATELSALKDELARKEQADKIKDNRIKQLETNLTTVERNLQFIAKALALNPTVENVEAALERRRAARLQSATAA